MSIGYENEFILEKIKNTKLHSYLPPIYYNKYLDLL
jgi:hypothetical protein